MGKPGMLQPTHVARLEFPREAGLILRCAGKAGNPFQTTQGNRLSCRDQEGRRGSDEAGPVHVNSGSQIQSLWLRTYPSEHH